MISSKESSKTLTKEEYHVDGAKKLYPNADPHNPKPVIILRSASAVPDKRILESICTDWNARDAILVVYDKPDMTLKEIKWKDQLPLLEKIFEVKKGDYLNIILSDGTGISAG
eukprot:883201_1